VAGKGGKGGRGNKTFVSGKNRSPQQFTLGSQGEDKWFKLELKLIAEVGLVGFPNAGKSSFLHCISNATPKIASYPFTTLNPNIGTIVFSDKYFIKVADLPGIMEDAHKGRGLGIQFLKHIERTKNFMLHYRYDKQRSLR